MTVHDVPMEEIVILGRRREDLGDIDGLAKSVEAYGLLHPITLTRQYSLVCGERRFAAFVQLGRHTIPAVFREDLIGDKLREVELEENLQRKDLTPYERSRTLANLAELVRKEANAEAPISAHFGPKFGRPEESGSGRDVAARLGVPRSDIQRAETHVATAEAYPEFKAPQWNQATVLHARRALSQLPDEDRAQAVAFVDAPTIPTKDAVGIIETLAEMPSEQREKVFALAGSADQRERDLAITIAAKKAACPDPRVLWLRGVIREGKSWLRQFPNDTLNPRYQSLIETCHSLADDTSQLHKEREDNATGHDH